MKSVVITGSSRGIGLSMAKEFLKAGCNVTLSARGGMLPDELDRDLAPYLGRYHYISCNVKRHGDLENLWRQAAEMWGRVDIWINNAGQNSPHAYCFDIDFPDVDAVLNTNIKGMVYGSGIAARNMLLQGGGQIWNMEGLGSNDMIQARTVLYGTSKRALTYFTRGLAKELRGTPVQAGRLSPGMMLTDFITRTPDGKESPVMTDKRFRFVFNALADRPETVAAFFVPRMLGNQKNDAQIIWLTSLKAAWRFFKSPFARRHLI